MIIFYWELAQALALYFYIEHLVLNSSELQKSAKKRKNGVKQEYSAHQFINAGSTTLHTTCARTHTTRMYNTHTQHACITHKQHVRTTLFCSGDWKIFSKVKIKRVSLEKYLRHFR